MRREYRARDNRFKSETPSRVRHASRSTFLFPCEWKWNIDTFFKRAFFSPFENLSHETSGSRRFETSSRRLTQRRAIYRPVNRADRAASAAIHSRANGFSGRPIVRLLLITAHARYEIHRVFTRDRILSDPYPRISTRRANKRRGASRGSLRIFSSSGDKFHNEMPERKRKKRIKKDQSV